MFIVIFQISFIIIIIIIIKHPGYQSINFNTSWKQHYCREKSIKCINYYTQGAAVLAWAGRSILKDNRWRFSCCNWSSVMEKSIISSLDCARRVTQTAIFAIKTCGTARMMWESLSPPGTSLFPSTPPPDRHLTSGHSLSLSLSPLSASPPSLCSSSQFPHTETHITPVQCKCHVNALPPDPDFRLAGSETAVCASVLRSGSARCAVRTDCTHLRVLLDCPTAAGEDWSYPQRGTKKAGGN